MKYYRNIIIPDIQELLKEIEKDIKQDLLNTKWNFSDFYIKSNYKKSTLHEYIRNQKSINSNFKSILNSKLNKKDKIMNEIKGLYVFYDKNDTPIYLGISKTIIRRIKQHFFGKIHNEATLVYLIAQHKNNQNSKPWKGNRDKLPTFINDRENIQKEMINNWKIQIIPEPDDYKMYLKEFYYSCHLKTCWNTFKTH